MPFLNRLSIAKKLGLLTTITGAGVVCVAAAFLSSEHTLVLDERSNAVRTAVDLASDIVGRYQQLAAAGTLPEAEAKHQALEAVRVMRFDGQNYIWVNDMQTRMLMHPVLTKLEGQDAAGVADPSGMHFFAEGTRIAKVNGAGFMTYYMDAPLLQGNFNAVQIGKSQYYIRPSARRSPLAPMKSADPRLIPFTGC